MLKSGQKICFFMEQFGLGGTDVQLANLISYWPDQADDIHYITNAGNKGMGFFDSLNKRPCKKTVINLRSRGYFLRMLSDSVFPKAVKSALNVLLVLMRYPLFMMDVFRLSLVIRREKFDIIVANNGGYPGSDSVRAMLFAAFLCRVPRRYLLVHHKAEKPHPCLIPVEFLLDKMIQVIIHGFIVVSNATGRALIENRFFTGKVNVIHNGIEDKKPTGHGINLRREYRIDARKKIIGLMANVEPHKGHAVLIDAIPDILNACPDVHFLFIGSLFNANWDRLWADHVIQLIKDKGLEPVVTLTGYLDGHPLDLIAQFDIVTMPTTDFEGFGIVLAEAMILKKPVVASAVGAIPEVIVDGESGILVPPSDAGKLSKAIVSLLVDEDKRSSMCNNARFRYEENFTAEIMARKYYNLLKN